MHSTKVLAAVAAMGAQLVAAQTACSKDYTVTSVAEATAIPCRTLEKNLVIDSDIAGALAIEGPSRIKGDLIITNATGLNSLTSVSLATIDGEFLLEGLTEIQSIEMAALTQIGSIKWIHLPGLNSLRLGQAGVTNADNVEISDTALASLDEFRVSSVNTMIVNNNYRLVSYTSALANVSSLLQFTDNGEDAVINLPSLFWANEIVFRKVSSVGLDALEYINDSLRFDVSSLKSFAAPNLTTIEKGDLAFVNNADVTNVTFPILTEIGGSLTLINNTALEVVEGFPELKTIGGAVRLGGNFKNVTLPAMETTAGDFAIVSTNNIDSTCDVFNAMEGKEIRGQYNCRGGDENANDAGSLDTDAPNSGGSGNGGSGAGMVSANIIAILSVAAAGVAALL